MGRQHHLKYLGSVSYSEVKGETDFLLVLLSSPLFFFFNSFSLLSQLPNISFEVYCWDFKRTLSTSAGVGFSEQARVTHSSRERSGLHTLPPSFFPGAAPSCVSCTGSRSPGVVSSQALGPLRVSPDGVAGVPQGCADFLPIFLKPVLKDLSSFRAAEKRLSNSHVLRFH